MALKTITIGLLLLCLVSCSTNEPQLSLLSEDAVILAYGDSLTYGSGANSETQSYPAVLQQLTGRTVINLGVPGERSFEGLERLPSVLEEIKPTLVILCHGGNDLIQKRDKTQLKQNLAAMISLIHKSGAEVVLIGVPAFSLTLAVPELYPELANEFQLPYDAHILPELEKTPKLKSDHIHPNAQGYNEMAKSIYTLLVSSGAVN
jgi:lysophospholipase L1-like esterase